MSAGSPPKTESMASPIPSENASEDASRDASRKARFERMVAEHYAFVWRSARRFGVREADLDDVVQEVFLSAARSLDTIHNERGFLFQTCHFLAGHARRAVERRREVMDEARVVQEADRAARPDESAEANELRARLQQILDVMPEELKEVFVLYELERFTTPEIASILDIAVGTAASRLRRARETFMGHATRAHKSEALR